MSDQSPQPHTDSLTSVFVIAHCDVRRQLVYTVNVFVCEFVQPATSVYKHNTYIHTYSTKLFLDKGLCVCVCVCVCVV